MRAKDLLPHRLPEEIKKGSLNWTVFSISLAATGLLVLWGLVAPKHFGQAVNKALNFFINYFDWSYLLIVSAFVIFCIWIAVSPLGNLKLGKPDDIPDYSLRSWLAMLFTVGMGIGVYFWGVAEPLYHYTSPPFGSPNSPEAVEIAMRYAFFHWGIHAWAIFAIVGLPIGYFSFKYGLPCTISAALYPLLKEKTWGIAGKIIDALAIFATLGGIATSTGLAALQINSGLNFLFGIPTTKVIQVIVVIISTLIFTLLAVKGIERGIKVFSEMSFYAMLFLLIFILVFGPFKFILQLFTDSIGAYLQNIIRMSFWTDPVKRSGWPGSWTVFYWAWWIAWAPFVGPFFARISKGRTIREFIIGVLLFPTLFDLIWFSIFGGSGLYFEIFNGGNIAEMVKKDVATSIFLVLKHYPLFSLMAVFVIMAAAASFIDSADAATFTAAMLSSNGNTEPSKRLKGLWGILCGAIAAILIFSGGLKALQTASIVAAFPFMLVMVAMCFAFVKFLFVERIEEKQ